MRVLNDQELDHVNGGILPIIVIGGALLLGGCAHFPKRPDPPPSDSNEEQ